MEGSRTTGDGIGSDRQFEIGLGLNENPSHADDQKSFSLSLLDSDDGTYQTAAPNIHSNTPNATPSQCNEPDCFCSVSIVPREPRLRSVQKNT